MGRLWLLGGIAMVVLWISLFAVPSTTDWWTARDISVLEWFVDIRTGSLTSLADAIAVLGSSWFSRVLRIGMIVALISVRPVSLKNAVLLAIIVVQATVEVIQEFVGRPRPFVTIIGGWNGPAHPSGPVARLGVTVAAMAYSLVSAGRRRQLALGVAGSLVVMLILAQLYLGVDHPSDAVVSGIFSFAVVVVLFRWFAPESTYPVTWRPGVTAHLDMTGERTEAIRRAIGEQLGLEVLEIKPLGWKDPADRRHFA